MLESEAAALSRVRQLKFEGALGVASSAPLPDRPVFVARFKEVERWSHEGILRAAVQPPQTNAKWPLMTLAELVDDLENGWSPKCLDHPAEPERWGILKVGAVSFGYFNESENKELPAQLEPRPYYEVKAGDVIISRANVTRYVGACAYVATTRPKLMLSDKLFRVKFKAKSGLDGRFLAAIMKLPTVREQIETSLTGASPTMKNISKPSLLNLQFPVPDLETQESLVKALEIGAKVGSGVRGS
jgi:type I restriction enzyme S subunit